MLQRLGRIAPQAMAAGVFVGLLLPPLAELLRPLLVWAVWGLLYLAMLRIGRGDLLDRARRPAFALVLLLWMLIVTPLLMTAALSPIDIRPGLAAAMILTAASSPLFSTPSLGLMFELDGALLLIVLVATTLLVPFSLPLAAASLVGVDLGADPLELMLRLGSLVLSATVAAVGTRRWFGEDRVRLAGGGIDGGSVVLLIVFAVAVMEGVMARIRTDPADIAYVTALTFAVYIGLMIVGVVVFATMPGIRRRGALSAGFISGTRNLALILAVLPENVDSDIPLFFAVGQFPIYIMPLVLKPVFKRLLGNPKHRPEA